MAWNIIIIVLLVLVVLAGGLYLLNRWASKRMVEQQDMIEKTKQLVTIYVIDKKKDKPTNANFPKAVQEKLTRMSKLMKMPLVKAKIGPQILTLMCDKKVYDVLPVKKNVKVELSGIYIAGMPGMKTKMEMDEAKRKRAGGTDEAPQKWYQKALSLVGLKGKAK